MSIPLSSITFQQLKVGKSESAAAFGNPILRTAISVCDFVLLLLWVAHSRRHCVEHFLPQPIAHSSFK
eukprot:1782765-Amphidinium_carterae.1